jgi:hypothetical protein
MNGRLKSNDQIITESPNSICLHDCEVSEAHLNDGKLEICFQAGLYNSEVEVKKSDKASIVITADSSQDFSFKRIKDHCICHRYFGVVTYVSFEYFEELIRKNKVFVNDEFYGEVCVMTFWVLGKKEKVIVEWPRSGNSIDVLYY